MYIHQAIFGGLINLERVRKPFRLLIFHMILWCRTAVSRAHVSHLAKATLVVSSTQRVASGDDFVIDSTWSRMRCDVL